jgi:TPR repeat protein
VEQGNIWSYFDLGWMVIRNRTNKITVKQGTKLYYESVIPGFTEALEDMIDGTIHCMNIEEQKHVFNLSQKYGTPEQLEMLYARDSVLNRVEFNIMNSTLGNIYKYPQNIGAWHEMDTKYIVYKKKSYVGIYDTIVTMPRELVEWFSKSVEQGNIWSYYDLGWMVIHNKTEKITVKQGKKLYYESIVPGFTAAIGDMDVYNMHYMNIEEQRYVYDIYQKYATSEQLESLCCRSSILNRNVFDTMNNTLGDRYEYPQTIGNWHKMDKEYTEHIRKTYVGIYDTIVTIPKELVQLVVDFI